MQLTIEHSALKSLLAKVTGAVAKKATIPALANVALIADGEVITAKATDLDIEVTATAPAIITTAGSITVNAALLAAIVAKLPSGSLVTLSLDDHMLTVKAGRSKSALQTLPIEDFPQMATADYSHRFTLQAHELARLFGLSKGAASTEETRYYLQGVYLHPTADNDICAVATDGHRLFKVVTPAHVDFPGVIVPAKTISELVKMLDIGEVVVSVSVTKIRFDLGATVLVSKVIYGTFPDYTRVIPKSNPLTITAKASDMKAASDRVATVSDTRSIGVKVQISGGSAVLSTQSNAGNSEDEVAVTYDGPDITLGFSAKYLAEVLAQCRGQDVTFEVSEEPMTPVLLRPSDDDGVTYVVMQYRV